MPYKLTYYFSMDWVGPGQGPSGTPPFGLGAGSNAQTFSSYNSTSIANIAAGSGTGGALAGADVTALTNAMAADVAAQINAPATLALINGWRTGNP